MKASHSRLSHHPDKRYSNIAHVQGGMITDADLSEAGQLHQARDEAQARVFAGSGIPAEGGMLRLEDKTVIFRDGTAIAEGKQGHFRIGDLKESKSISEVFAHQVDLPFGPEPVDKGFVYLDVWERPVFAVEDPYLADVGLHGAETTYRTRTMVQLKMLPGTVLEKEEQLQALLRSHDAFRATGDAEVTLAEINSSFTPVDCDPCANEIAINAEPPNGLFRLEVTSVRRNAKGQPLEVQVAWSNENAEVIERIEDGEALKRKNHIYESISQATESQQGYFDQSQTIIGREFSTELPAPLKPSEIEKIDKEGRHRFTHVRRWDGMVSLRANLSGDPEPIGNGSVSRKNDMWMISTEYFNLALDLKGRDVMIGDYWLVEMRRYAPDGEQLILNGGSFKTPARPFGTRHHYLPLFFTVDDQPFNFDDATRRRLSMPALSDLPASHVAYTPPRNCDLLSGSETAKEALDKLCGLDATHVAFDNSDPDCDTLADADNVHDALLRLCEADKKSQTQLMLRSMMDWGVVAGLKVLRSGNELTLTPGVALDRTGILHEIAPLSFDLRELTERNVFPNKLDLQDVQKERGEICLCIGFNGKEETIFLTDPVVAYDLDDLTMKDQIEACLDAKFEKDQTLLNSKTLQEMTGGKDDRAVEVLTKLHIAFRRDMVPINGLGLDKSETAVAQQLLKGLLDEMSERLTPDMMDRLMATLQKLEEEGQNVKAKVSQEQLNLLRAGVAYAAIINFDEEFRIQCVCENIVPPMPETQSGWTLVPIAGIVLSKFGFKQMVLDRVCMTSCRKQSHNWRSFRYYYGDTIQHIFNAFDDMCCEGKLKPEENTAETLGEWNKARGTAPWDGEPEMNIWPVMPTYSNTRATGGNLQANRLAQRGGWKNGPNTKGYPIVAGKSADEARELLEKDKYKVVGDSHINELAELLEMSEDRKPLLNRRPQPGDSVVLVHDGKMAIEFVVVKQNREIEPGIFKFKPWFNLGKIVQALDVNRGLKTTEEPKKERPSRSGRGPGRRGTATTGAKDVTVTAHPGLLHGAILPGAAVAHVATGVVPGVKGVGTTRAPTTGGKGVGSRRTTTSGGKTTASTTKTPPARSKGVGSKRSSTAGAKTGATTAKAPAAKKPPTSTAKRAGSKRTTTTRAKTTTKGTGTTRKTTTKPAATKTAAKTTAKAPAAKPKTTRAKTTQAKTTTRRTATKANLKGAAEDAIKATAKDATARGLNNLAGRLGRRRKPTGKK